MALREKQGRGGEVDYRVSGGAEHLRASPSQPLGSRARATRPLGVTEEDRRLADSSQIPLAPKLW